MSATTEARTGGQARPIVSLRGVSKTLRPDPGAARTSRSELRAGEVMCLAGENGAGKSTLIKILTGAVQRDEGAYEIEGRDMGDPSPPGPRRPASASSIRSSACCRTCRSAENLMMGRLPARRGVTRPGELKRRAKAMLERVGLEWLDPKTHVAETSLAVRQLVEIAKVLGADAACPDLRRADDRAVGVGDEGAARPHPRAARRGPRDHVRLPPPRGDVRDRRPRDVLRDGGFVTAGADERVRPGQADRLDGRPQDRVAVSGDPSARSATSG